MTLYEHSSILRVICDDLVNCVQNGNHCISLEIFHGVLLPTRQVSNKVPQSVVPCKDKQEQKLWVCRCRRLWMKRRSFILYRSSPYSFCQWRGCEEQWPRLARLCPRLSAAAPLKLAVLSLSSPWLECSSTTARRNTRVRWLSRIILGKCKNIQRRFLKLHFTSKHLYVPFKNSNIF